MGFAGPQCPSARNCRYGSALIEQRRTDPDAEFLGGSNRANALQRIEVALKPRNNRKNKGAAKVQIRLSPPTSPGLWRISAQVARSRTTDRRARAGGVHIMPGGERHWLPTGPDQPRLRAGAERDVVRGPDDEPTQL
jgi:hypothetical protein